MAIDWTAGMSQTFRYCKVDPSTWEDAETLESVTAASIKFDFGLETLGNASLSLDGGVDECYVRVYLSARQGSEREDVPLGTFLVQTPVVESDGRRRTSRCACYSPLLEAREKYPAIGAMAPSGTTAEATAGRLLSASMRAPFQLDDEGSALRSAVVADPSQNVLEYAIQLLDIADKHLTVDGLGRVGIAPNIEPGSAQPRWVFRDDSASIVKADKRDAMDWYGIPNTVEVVWSGGGRHIVKTSVNDDKDSPLSIAGRGRAVVLRVLNPSITNPSPDDLQAYADRELRRLCAMDRTVTVRHGWCGVRMGDCVRLELERDGIYANGIVTAQTVTCETGCECESTIVWTEDLWRNQ